MANASLLNNKQNNNNNNNSVNDHNHNNDNHNNNPNNNVRGKTIKATMPAMARPIANKDVAIGRLMKRSEIMCKAASVCVSYSPVDQKKDIQPEWYKV